MNDMNEKKIPSGDGQKDKAGAFTGFLLLSESKWDKLQFIADIKKEWDIDIPLNGDDENDILYATIGEMSLVVALMPAPVPNGEAEHFAKANYMWRDAENAVSNHKAHLIVTVLGNGDMMERARLYVKAASSLLGSKNAVALYSEGAVYQPAMYRSCAGIMKEGGDIPVLNLVWIGIFGNGNIAGVYTYGMRRLGKEEMEVYVEADKADLEKLRGFILDVATYVLYKNAELLDGQTIGFSENQKFPIIVNKGVAVNGQTIKIRYQD